MKKISFVCMFLVIISIIFSTSSMAESAFNSNTYNKAGLFWTEISQFNNGLTISSNGKADIESCLYSFSVDELKVEVELQQYKDGVWINIKEWLQTSTDISCMVFESWYVQKGFYYRLVSTGTVYKEDIQVEQTVYIGQDKWY